MLGHDHPPLQDLHANAMACWEYTFLGIRGYNGQVDALHDALVMIKMDGKLLLDEYFMNNIFS